MKIYSLRNEWKSTVHMYSLQMKMKIYSSHVQFANENENIQFACTVCEWKYTVCETNVQFANENTVYEWKS